MFDLILLSKNSISEFFWFHCVITCTHGKRRRKTFPTYIRPCYAGKSTKQRVEEGLVPFEYKDEKKSKIKKIMKVSF